MVSTKGIALIKQWEGCRLESYDDGTGTWTIGWGHTAGVKPGDTITQEEADALLLSDVKIYNDAVTAYDQYYDWTQNEEDALTSFAYNLGTGSIAQVTANHTRTKPVIAEKMLLYVNAGGKYMEGLANRRKQERALFLDTSEGGTPIDPDNPGGGEDPDLPNGNEYFDRFDDSSARIDYVFSHIGATDYYSDEEGPWQKRKPIAYANGISDYSGKSWQNATLEHLARAGRLRRPT